MLSDKSALLEYLSAELGMEAVEVRTVWNAMARAILYHATILGSVETPMGRVAMTGDGLAIVEQNSEVIKALSTQSSPEAIKSQLCALLTG